MPRSGSARSRPPARRRRGSRSFAGISSRSSSRQTFHDRFLKLGGYDPVGNTPEEFRQFLAQDRVRGEELVKLSGVKITQ